MQTRVKNGFPGFEDRVRELVADHVRLKDEPLVLAVYFSPERDAGDVFLLEVVDGFGANEIADEKLLYEVTYGHTPSFPLSEGHRLHLILTNPAEFSAAVNGDWDAISELRKAKRSGKWSVVHSTDYGNSIEKTI